MTAERGHNRLDEAELARVKRLRKLAFLLDSQFRIPGTKIRFGLDSILGLLPGAGDTVTAMMAAYIVFEAWRIGIPKQIIGRMLGNLLIDWVIGSVPVIGDIFDVGFKANERNIRLIEEELGLGTDTIR